MDIYIVRHPQAFHFLCQYLHKQGVVWVSGDALVDVLSPETMQAIEWNNYEILVEIGVDRRARMFPLDCLEEKLALPLLHTHVYETDTLIQEERSNEE